MKEQQEEQRMKSYSQPCLEHFHSRPGRCSSPLLSTKMKAWLFLVLLMVKQAAGWSKTGTYGWGSKAISANTNICQSADSNCRCCLMMQKVRDLSDQLNDKLSKLKTEYKETLQIHQDLEKKRSAFSGALFKPSNKTECLTNEVLVYKVVLINMGNDYNTKEGFYTAPYNGFYIISVTVAHDANLAGSSEVACIQLYINEKVITGSNDDSKSDVRDTMTVTTAVQLKVGDKVQVKRKPSCIICQDKTEDNYNVFSVFLLTAD